MSPSACRRLSVSWSRSKFKIFRHLIPNIKLVLEWENLVNIQPYVSGAFISSDEHFGLMILLIKKNNLPAHIFSGVREGKYDRGKRRRNVQTKWSFTMKMYSKNLTVLSQHRNTYYFNLRPEMRNVFLYNFKKAMQY